MIKDSDQTLFFDLDGTLTDPKEGITRSIQYSLDKLGAPVPTQDELEWCIGPPLLESMALLTDEASAQAGVDYYRERFADVGWSENSPYEGIEQTLTQLQTTGVQLYVATSKPHVFANRILDHFNLRQFFIEVFGAELDGTHSNKVELLAMAKETVGNPEYACMIGDRQHDIVGGLANGMNTVGVTYGYGGRTELVEAGAHVCVDTPQQILDCFI